MIDINEILDGLRSTVKYPALILENLSGSYMASNLDNPLEVINGGFLIIGHLDQVDDFAAEMQLVSRMKQIGTDIIARILHDHHKCELLVLKAIPGFNINSVSYEILGPVFDNDYGAFYSFKIHEIIDIEYDSSLWVLS